MTPKRPPMAAPVPIGSLVTDLLDGLRPAGDGHLKEIFLCWEALVGPDIAANARPVGFKRHMLLVHVASSVWMQQLQFLKAELIARINDGLPGADIEEIRFKIGPL